MTKQEIQANVDIKQDVMGDIADDVQIKVLYKLDDGEYDLAIENMQTLADNINKAYIEFCGDILCPIYELDEFDYKSNIQELAKEVYDGLFHNYNKVYTLIGKLRDASDRNTVAKEVYKALKEVWSTFNHYWDKLDDLIIAIDNAIYADKNRQDQADEQAEQIEQVEQSQIDTQAEQVTINLPIGEDKDSELLLESNVPAILVPISALDPQRENAVIIALIDQSGSMGDWEMKMAKEIAFWTRRTMRLSYTNVEMQYIGFTSDEAKVVSEDEAFKNGMGGTKASVGLKKALEVALDWQLRGYAPFVLVVSDGDNQITDNATSRFLIETISNNLIPVVVTQVRGHTCASSGTLNDAMRNLYRNNVFFHTAVDGKSIEKIVETVRYLGEFKPRTL